MMMLYRVGQKSKLLTFVHVFVWWDISVITLLQTFHSVPVKEFWNTLSIWWRYEQEFTAYFFSPPCRPMYIFFPKGFNFTHGPWICPPLIQSPGGLELLQASTLEFRTKPQLQPHCYAFWAWTSHLAPNYLSTMCQPVAENPSRQYLRSAVRGDLAVPVTRTTHYDPCSFAVAGPSTWNSLPALLQNCQLSSSFQHELKTELFARACIHLGEH